MCSLKTYVCIMMIHSLASCDYIVMFAFWPVVTLERPCDGLASCSGCALSGQTPVSWFWVQISFLLDFLHELPLVAKRSKKMDTNLLLLPSKLPTPCYSHACYLLNVSNPISSVRIDKTTEMNGCFFTFLLFQKDLLPSSVQWQWL